MTIIYWEIILANSVFGLFGFWFGFLVCFKLKSHEQKWNVTSKRTVFLSTEMVFLPPDMQVYIYGHSMIIKTCPKDTETKQKNHHDHLSVKIPVNISWVHLNVSINNISSRSRAATHHSTLVDLLHVAENERRSRVCDILTCSTD